MTIQFHTSKPRKAYVNGKRASLQKAYDLLHTIPISNWVVDIEGEILIYTTKN